MLRVRLGPSLSLRFLLLLGIPDSECREASSKLRASLEIGLTESCGACSFPSMFLTADVGWLSGVCSLVLMMSILENVSGALVGQGSALIACLWIRPLFRRRPTEALGRGSIVMVQPRLRSLVNKRQRRFLSELSASGVRD
ncbi:hypothetical protein Tco_0753931 [Tanacetum coccineum]